MKMIVTRDIDHVATGAKMRYLRKVAALSLREVARRLGVSAPYVCDLEHGRRKWTAERARGYVRAL